MTTTTPPSTLPSPWPTSARAHLEPVRYRGRTWTRVSCVGGCTLPGHTPLVLAETDAQRHAAERDADHARQALRAAPEVAA